MKMQLNIPEQLIILQRRNDKTTEELAAVIGVTSQNYNRRLRLNSFTSQELEKLAEYLKCTVEITENK